jgi:hypothetical protein
MHRSIVLFLLIVLLACAVAKAQDRSFGLGVILGEPTGISGKYWIDGKKAIDGAVAWSFGDESALHLHADFLFHTSSIVKEETSKLLAYYGIGGRIKFADESKAGVRIPLGLNYVPLNAPVDVFFEIVPILNLAPSTDLSLNAAIGFRYFFGQKRHK